MARLSLMGDRSIDQSLLRRRPVLVENPIERLNFAAASPFAKPVGAV